LDVNGVAPNATAYCPSPDYFDFWTFGSDVDGEVAGTTSTGPGGIDMILTDRAGVGGGLRLTIPSVGVIFDSDDDGTVTLSQPIFYSQWVFVDVDLNSEGFEVTGCVGGDSLCGGGAAPSGVAVMGQNAVFTGGMVTTTQAAGFARFNVGSGSNIGPTTIDSRFQVDFLGAVDKVFLDKVGTGGAGFAVGGGCEPIGIAKESTAPVEDGLGNFVLTFTLRVTNNLPTAATIASVLSAAEAASFAGQFSGPVASPPEIPILNLQVTDDLAAVFGAGNFAVSSLNTGSLTPNPLGFDGETVTDLLAGSDTLNPGGAATITFDVTYTPPVGTVFPLNLTNQAVASGSADGVTVQDLSDDGGSPAPADDNGSGGTDDPTPLVFAAAPAAPPAVVIPTVDGVGMLLLVLSLALAAGVLLRTRM
jgi:hypothetical protein